MSYHHGDLPTALLEAAETLLEREGIGALTLRAAAREAGVSHAAPSHHFGDLSGLLSELAASGFNRFHDHLAAHTAEFLQTPSERLRALSRGYIDFAQRHPALFQLMFRSERLDWGRASLSRAGASAFALLTLPEDTKEQCANQPGFPALAAAMARWSFAHGLAMLIIDGKLDAVAAQIAGADVEQLIEATLKLHP